VRKPLYLFALLALLSGAWLSACSGPQVLNSFTSTKDFDKASNLPYDEANGLRLDVYTPKQERNVPVVIFFHGGRWNSGNKDEYEFVAGALATKGYVTVIPNIRQYPMVKFPAFEEDGARVVKWARDNIRQFGGDPDKIFLMGHSSGAHTAAMIALNEQYLQAVGGSRSWLRGMIGMAGPYDFLPITDPMLRDIFGPPERFELSQPVIYTDGRNPPLLLIHGEDDETVQVKNTRNLAASVSRAGGPVETLIYPKMSHQKLISSIGPYVRNQNDVLVNISVFIEKWSDTAYRNRSQTPGLITTPLPP
jgi:acetyl esterase/lipase